MISCEVFFSFMTDLHTKDLCVPFDGKEFDINIRDCRTDTTFR